MFNITRKLHFTTLMSNVHCQHNLIYNEIISFMASSGTDFMFGVTKPGSVFPPYLNLYITTEGHADVRIIAPHINLDTHLNEHQSTSYNLNKTLVQLTNGTEFKGIAIHSNVSISVIVMTYNGGDYDGNEGFLALPVTALGTSYVASSYHPMSGYFSEFQIVDVEATTKITIHLPLAYQRRAFTKQLQKFESYQFQGKYDISGTSITSDKPVAVMSGSSFSHIPIGKGDYQYLVEQMLPTNLWSYKYIIPPIYPRWGYVIKIFALENNTEVNYRSSTHHSTAFIDKAGSVELQFRQEATIVTANKPINVIQYGYDVDGSAGDPFMMNVQAVSQYQPSYTFQTQTRSNSGYNTIAITIKKTDLSGLLLNNGHNVFSSAISKLVASPMDDYINVFLNVSYNSHFTLTHSSNKTFGAVLYGAYNTISAYGYMLPTTFTYNTECAASTTTTTSVTTLQHSNIGHINTSYHSNGNESRCFSCDEMSSLKYCDTVEVCSENEICYVQSVVGNKDVKHFRSGCTTETQQKRSDSENCFECCHGDYCNSHGCGDDGILSIGSRGMFCFDCQHISTQEDCQQVRICDHNQVCIIQKYDWAGGEQYFSMGCSHALTFQCSGDKRSLMARDRFHKDIRNTPVCVSCCNSDFCNVNCTTTVEHGITIVNTHSYWHNGNRQLIVNINTDLEQNRT